MVRTKRKPRVVSNKQRKLVVYARRKRKPPKAGVSKASRIKPRTVALSEIRRYQKSTKLVIPKDTFKVLSIECLKEHNPIIKPTNDFFVALQEAAESHIVGLLEDSNLLAIHANRKTIVARDLNLAVKLKQVPEEIYYS